MPDCFTSVSSKAGQKVNVWSSFSLGDATTRLCRRLPTAYDLTHLVDAVPTLLTLSKSGTDIYNKLHSPWCGTARITCLTTRAPWMLQIGAKFILMKSRAHLHRLTSLELQLDSDYVVRLNEVAFCLLPRTGKPLSPWCARRAQRSHEVPDLCWKGIRQKENLAEQQLLHRVSVAPGRRVNFPVMSH